MKALVHGASFLVATLLTTSFASANVLVVAAGGGGAFLDIQPALDVAQDGDTILVKSGTYHSFSIVNKAVVVIADANAVVVVNGGVEVRSLAATRDVVLAGMTLNGQSGATDWHLNGLYLKNDLGSVRVHCTINGGNPAALVEYPPCAGAMIVSCADVAFVGCAIKGGIPVAPWHATSGLSATGSMVAVYDGSLIGGNGAMADCDYGVPASNGGAGAILTDCFLFGSGAAFTGGNGGPGGQRGDCKVINGANGGAGLVLVSATSTSDAELLGATLTGGNGGQQGFNGLFHGLPGALGVPAVVGANCTLDTLAGSKRVLGSASVVRELAPLALTFHGQPGDLVGMYVGTSTSFHYLPALEGVKLVSGTQTPVYATLLGLADASGNLSTSFSFPDLGPGVQAREYYLQAIVITAQGSRVLGSPISLTVLDSAF